MMVKLRTLIIAAFVVLLHVLMLYQLSQGLQQNIMHFASSPVSPPIMVEIISTSPVPSPQLPTLSPAPAEPATPVLPVVPELASVEEKKVAETPEKKTEVLSPQPDLPAAPVLEFGPIDQGPITEKSINTADYLIEMFKTQAPLEVDSTKVQCIIPKPDYPPDSERLQEEGTASVRLIITPEGLLEKAELAISSGFERLDQAALASANIAQCQPYIVDFIARRIEVAQPFTFQLK